MTQLTSGNCVFSSTSNRWVRISCISAQVTPTLATGGGFRNLRSGLDEEGEAMAEAGEAAASEPFDWAVAMETGGLVL